MHSSTDCSPELGDSWEKTRPASRKSVVLNSGCLRLDCLEPKVKACAQISAITEAFKILQQGVIDKEHRDQLNAIRSTLEQIEGETPNVIDV